MTSDQLDGFLLTVQGTMAFADLFQVPLIFAIVYSVKLTRRWGRAWKGIGVAFGGYAAWVVLTAFLIGFSPSGYVLLTLGTLLDPVDPTWNTSNVRVWACGIVGTLLLFWLMPTGVAWLVRRRSERTIPVPPQPGSSARPAAAGLLLLGAQQVMFAYAGHLGRVAKAQGIRPIEDGSTIPWGLAAALTIPVVWLLAVAVIRSIRRRWTERASSSG